MMRKRPSNVSWADQGEIFDLMAINLFQHLQESIKNAKTLNFGDLYQYLETWKSFTEGDDEQESNRWDIMYSLLWCAERASKGISRCVDLAEAPELIKKNKAWARNCIELLRGENRSTVTSSTPIAISNPLDGVANIFNFVLEILESGDGEIFHHPMDMLATLPSSDFIDSARIAWNAARKLMRKSGVDIQYDVRWRLLDRYNKPITRISGRSASAAVAMASCFALQRKVPDDGTVILAQIKNDGKLASVMGIKEKVKAIAADGRFDTIITVSQADHKEAQETLKEQRNANIAVVNAGTNSKTLENIVDLCSVASRKYSFDSGDLRDWEISGEKGEWKIEDGELSGRSKRFPSSELLIADSGKWADYKLECKVKLLETFEDSSGSLSWVAVVIRYQDTGNNCVFALDFPKQTVNIDFEYAGDPKITKTHFDVVKNKYYKLKVTANGNHLQFFIDDRPIHECIYNSFSRGKVGVLIVRAHAHFDDFMIEGKGINAE